MFSSEFTYGEFDFFFFAELLDKAHSYCDLDSDGHPKDWHGKTFVDIGSGMGRLVLAAAALHPHWNSCRGIELLKGIHNAAEENLKKCRLSEVPAPQSEEPVGAKPNELCIPCSPMSVDSSSTAGRPTFPSISDDDWLKSIQSEIVKEDSFNDGSNEAALPPSFDYDMDKDLDQRGITPKANEASFQPVYALYCPPTEKSRSHEAEALPLAPVELVCGSFEDPYVYLGDVDLVFVFSSAFPKDVMESLSRCIGTKCKPGTIVITIDYALVLDGYVEPSVSEEYGIELPAGPYKLEIVEQVDGWCWLTGGLSTAYIHRVQTSLWEQQEQIKNASIEDKAIGVVRALESGQLKPDHESFLRGVYNNMVFHDMPESWRPKLK